MSSEQLVGRESMLTVHEASPGMSMLTWKDGMTVTVSPRYANVLELVLIRSKPGLNRGRMLTAVSSSSSR